MNRHTRAELSSWDRQELEDAIQVIETELERARDWREVRALVEAVDLLLDTLPDTCMFDDDPSWDWAWNELSGDAQSRVKFARDEAIAALAPFEEQKK